MPDPERRPAARADLRAIVDRISDHDPDAALTLADEIEAKAGRLPEHPRLCRRGRVPGTREMVVRPNWVVTYAERGGAVTILRVLHAARRWP